MNLQECVDTVMAGCAEIKGAVDRKRRRDLRDEMRNHPDSLQKYVIETCIDYHHELKLLETGKISLSPCFSHPLWCKKTSG